MVGADIQRSGDAHVTMEKLRNRVSLHSTINSAIPDRHDACFD